MSQGALTSLFAKSDAVQRCQPQSLNFRIFLTGAKTNAFETVLNPPVLLGYDSADLTQAIVDAYLGHASTIPCATAFSSTSLGTDAIGFVVNMEGGAGSIVSLRADVIETAGGTPANSFLLVNGSQSDLTSSLSTAVAVSSDGDIYGRIIAGNLDSATAGFIDMTIFYRSK